ncbi:MAG: hypothetical protein WDA16_02580 [Candidatus Thermoplasmatota archaeon]
MRAWRGVALAALLLAPLLPMAGAGTPANASWAPFDMRATVNAVALSASGTTLAAVTIKNVNQTEAPPAPTVPTCDPTNPISCIPQPPTPAPSQPATDMGIFDADGGFAMNGTGSTAPLGRTFTSVSADGKAIASVGFDASASGGATGLNQNDPTTSGVPTLYYQYLTSGVQWTPSAANNVLKHTFTGSPVAMLMSLDDTGTNHTRIVVASNAGTNFNVFGYYFDGTQLLSQFTLTQPGHVYGLGATSDLGAIAAATQIPDPGNKTTGALWTISFTGGQTGTFYDRSVNGSAFLSVGITPDGRYVAGDNAGRVQYLDHTNEFTVLKLGAAANVTPLVLSSDGSRAAVASGTDVIMLDTARMPKVIWNASFTGAVKDLRMNRNGGTLLAAVNGTDGGIYAFGDVDATPLWKVLGNVDTAAIDAEGNTVAFAQRGTVTLAKIPHAIAFEFAGGVKTAPPRPVLPLGSATFEVNVRNPGAALEHVVFIGPRDTDVTIAPDPSTLAVAPGESKKVILTATAGRSFTGRHSFNVTAKSMTSGVMDNVTLSLTLQTATDVSLALNGSSEVTVAAGVRTDILLGVRNNGSRDVAIGMRAVQRTSDGGAWNLVLDPATFTLAPNTITSVRVSVTAPVGTPNGTSDTVTFIMEGPDVADQAQVTFRINPTIGVDINAVGRVKFVEPGKIAFFNVTVTNTGSLPRTFQAFFQATPSGGKDWQVDMDTTNFQLDPLASRTIPLKIYAPQAATPNDRVSVFVIARTMPELVNENVTQANVTLFANAIPLQPTTTTPTSNPIPAPSAVASLGAITVLSLVLRSRRRDA